MSNERIRILVFPTEPTTILVHAGEAFTGDLALPPLAVPFTRGAVSSACKVAGVLATVIETIPGRFTRAAITARAAEKSERSSRAKVETALRSTVFLGANNPIQRDRAVLVKRLEEIPVEAREVRASIAAATGAVARGGSYLRRAEFNALRDRESAIKIEMVAVQGQLAALNKKEKEQNIAKAAKEQKEFAGRFIDAAREVLDKETFMEIVEMANDVDGEEESEET